MTKQAKRPKSHPSPRPRGRPKGSEIDDHPILEQIADLIVQGQSENVAAAVRRIAGHEPSLIRRLQRKFQRDRDRLLAEAHQRAEQQAQDQQTWGEALHRVTHPLDWHQERDPAMRMLDAVSGEQQERLKKVFRRRSA